MSPERMCRHLTVSRVQLRSSRCNQLPHLHGNQCEDRAGMVGSRQQKHETRWRDLAQLVRIPQHNSCQQGSGSSSDHVHLSCSADCFDCMLLRLFWPPAKHSSCKHRLYVCARCRACCFCVLRPSSGTLPCNLASPESMQPIHAQAHPHLRLQGRSQGRRPSQGTCCPGACTLQAASCTVQHPCAPACLQGHLEGRGAAQRGWPLRGSLMVSVPDDGLTGRPSMTTVDRDRGISVVSGPAALHPNLPHHEPQPGPGRVVCFCWSQTAIGSPP